MNGIVSDDDDFKIPKDIKCPCIAQLQESSCKSEFLTSFRCYLENRIEGKGLCKCQLFGCFSSSSLSAGWLVICKPEFDRMESCMRKHPEEFGDEDIKMFEETVRSGFKFRDFLGFSRSLRKQNKNE
ncbi:uncharacterized protein Gasu_50260 [Galdieria sulphuraria]|uniref:Uncharacterized protein n=1 Tax=Galdieria sulphuraria TaxID=130081 RepID=M2XUW9_GALSU|nr:uncharacterized protein Gasu_50260 [Galdieria sulphuraria]EME27433.1 hypothetical protein Gasu_50260 [Galdieria sulphuraria]|eukprot:XP_005703953.1 hypothetical protein Gasu_50260 [Galdieria sulphuraria]